jgi:hypothetical protein
LRSDAVKIVAGTIWMGKPGARVAISLGVGLAVAVALLRTAMGRAIVQALPQSWLVGVQAYRGLGSIFLVLTGGGLIPGAFGLPAGFGDVGIGLVAIPLAAFYVLEPRAAWPALAVWNLLGLADLVMAVSLALLTSPAIHVLPGPPNYLLTKWPMDMIALFAVPLSAILHVVSLAKLAGDHQTVPGPAGAKIATSADDSISSHQTRGARYANQSLARVARRFRRDLVRAGGVVPRTRNTA